MSKTKTIKIALRKSVIGCTEIQRANVKGLGLNRVGAEKSLPNTPAVRGMIKKVIHLVEILAQ